MTPDTDETTAADLHYLARKDDTLAVCYRQRREIRAKEFQNDPHEAAIFAALDAISGVEAVSHKETIRYFKRKLDEISARIDQLETSSRRSAD